MKSKILFLLSSAFSILFLFACAGNNGMPMPNAKTAQVFLTDDLNTGYDHVWVTIDSVVLTKTDGTTVTVFDETAAGGVMVDLSSLHDSIGKRFLHFCGFENPGTFSKVDITVASGLTLFATGNTTGIAATFDGASGATFTISVPFPTNMPLGSNDDDEGHHQLVVDWNLANWTLNGTTVSADNGVFATIGTREGIDDDSRHDDSDHRGVISNLAGTSPTQTFTVSHGEDTFAVATSATTIIVNSDGSANPVLANGQKVELTGTFDATANVFNVTNIVIVVGGIHDEDASKVRGLVTAFDAIAGTLTIQTRGESEGCDQSSHMTVNVVVDANTVFFGVDGATLASADFFALLTANAAASPAIDSRVSARGTLENGIFTATSISMRTELMHHDD